MIQTINQNNYLNLKSKSYLNGMSIFDGTEIDSSQAGQTVKKKKAVAAYEVQELTSLP